MLNRSAVIVRPGQAYIDWAENLGDVDMLPTIDGEHTVYLIPGYDDELDALEALSQCYGAIFELELAGWHPDDSQWPKNRTFALFREWFVIEFHSLVRDLCDHPVVDHDALLAQASDLAH
jgi:hypothetical protein